MVYETVINTFACDIAIRFNTTRSSSFAAIERGHPLGGALQVRNPTATRVLKES